VLYFRNHETRARNTKNAEQRKHSAILRSLFGILPGFLLFFLALNMTRCPAFPELFPTGEPDDRISCSLDSEILSILAAFDARNKAAIEDAANRISDGIDDYRKGIKPFVEDISSWTTRFGVVWRIGGDYFDEWFGTPAEKSETSAFVSERFERHLFSERKLELLLASALEQFRYDLAANRNVLHADVKAAWNKRDVAIHESKFENIAREVNLSVTAASTNMATDSVSVAALSFLGGFLIEEIAETITRAVLERAISHMATSAVLKAVSAGGTTVTLTAGGGATGAPAGPLGSVAGMSVGILSGIVADWYLTDLLEEKLASECDEMISGVTSQVLFGTAKAPGLKQILAESITILKDAEEKALRKALRKALLEAAQ
jgi:hypothetical protein